MPRILTRTISPKRKFNFSYFEQEIRDELKSGVATDLKTDLKGTTRGWDHDVDFGSRVNVTKNQISVDLYAQGANRDLFNMLDEGARAHLIVPKNPKGYLRFREGYTPATSPNSLMSGRKARSGQIITTKTVNHPGFEGRNFYKTVAENYKTEFKRRIENALKRAARRQ